MAAQEGSILAPGFRFHPTDEELVRYYLKRKLTGKTLHVDAIAVVDIYKFEPWELPSQSMLKTRDLEWYFFTCLDMKYGSGSRTNRATEKGYWKTTGKDRPIKHLGRDVGMKKTLVYHEGRAPKGKRSNWVMHEYRMVDPELARAGVNQNAFVVCRIFEKSGSGPKNGEKYGAPLVEEEWEHNEVAPPVLVGGGVGDFIETLDLDQQKLDKPVGSDGSTSNFYYGECSRYPEGRQESIEEQKPFVGPDRVFGPPSGYDFNVTEPNPRDSAELGHNGNPLDLINAADDLDVYLDASDFSQIFDGSFLETDDLLNPVEGGFTVPEAAFAVPEGGLTAAGGDFTAAEGDYAAGDQSDMDMIEAYLNSFSDEDDITKYISFDSPQSVESENSVPALQQNGEGDAAAASENTNPFVKKANELLAKIPAAPAFASEYPSKDIALRIRSAPQSSDAANITAAMVTVRGNFMDGMVGKNGRLNNIIIAGFSHPDVAIMVPVSVSGRLCSKTAFVVTHGWIFMVLFSVLFLSITYKIGSCMYTSK